MARATTDLTSEELAFLTERHLATLTTLRPDGRPHVVAIAFTYEPGIVRIITGGTSRKVRNVEHDGWGAVCQVEGRRWLTLEGPAVVTSDPDRVARAVTAHERRYRPVSESPERVAIEIAVDRILGRAG